MYPILLKDIFFLWHVKHPILGNNSVSTHWRGCRLISVMVWDYVYQVDDLRNEDTEDTYVTGLQYYCDSNLDTKAIISHILSSEAGMPVIRRMALQ